MTDDCHCVRCTIERKGPKIEIVPGFEISVESSRMFCCDVCGNKRCPHSDDHRNACTGSNEVGQAFSRYGILADHMLTEAQIHRIRVWLDRRAILDKEMDALCDMASALALQAEIKKNDSHR